MAELEVWSDLAAPVTIDPQGAIKKVINADAVKVSIDNILRTRKTERVMLPQFGSRISAFVFEPIDEQMFNTFTDEIRISVTNWDNRVSVQHVSFKSNPDRNFVQATVIFSIKGFDNIFKHTTIV